MVNNINNYPDVTGFILAGGKSSRMGRDKRSIMIGGTTLLDNARKLLKRVLGDDPFIVGDNLSQFKLEPVKIIPDAIPECGPLGGLVAALEISSTNWNLILAVDLPMLEEEDINILLKDDRGENDIVALGFHNVPEPLVALYNKKTIHFWKERLERNNLSLRSGIKNLKCKLIEIGSRSFVLKNINHPIDFSEIEKKIEMPTHLCIVGKKNSGKTTVIEGLIKEFNNRGFSVATVKHTSHDHEFDQTGTDSWKHSQAGSETAIIISPTRWVCHTSLPDSTTKDKLEEILFQNKDIVVWEGRGHSTAPLIECVESGQSPIYKDEKQLIAVITDKVKIDGIPNFTRDSSSELVKWIIKILDL